MTGVSGQGVISNTASDLVFSGGLLVLDSSIDVTGHGVVNSGAMLGLFGTTSITGNYTQSAGALVLNPGLGTMVVSGIANVSGGGVLTAVSGTGNYLAGDSFTLIQGGAGSSYSGAIVSGGSVPGLDAAGSVATIGGNTNLLLSVNNDYVGGTLGSIVNSGTLSAATAVYVASTGTLGTLVNTGTVMGDVVNQSAGNLTIVGGSASNGVFTGQSGAQGMISSANGDVVLASGKILLDDSVAVSGHALVNTGASVELDRAVDVTGNFGQSGGTLGVVASGGLIVSGTANLTGGTIAVSGLSSTGNYLAGDTAGTIIQGGVGSAYTGLAYTANVGGLEIAGATQGTNLLASVTNDYVGGSLGTLSNTSSLGGNTAIYVASTGSIGALLNSAMITANVGLANQGMIGGIANSGVFDVGGTAITNTGSIGQLDNTGSIVAAASAGIYNGGTIAAINNSGALINSQVSAGSGQVGAIVNVAALGALTNSGTIAGPVALFNSGSLGTIANTGTIAGNIENVSAQDLVFTGGTGGTFGTLTGHGAGSQGMITNLVGNVVMGSGGIVLNDAVNVGTGTLINAGATLQLTSIVAVTGNYAQASGTLALGQSSLLVSGIANISGGLITTTQFDATGNYIAGSNGGALVQGGAGSSYLGVGVASGINGLSIATSVGTIGSTVNLLLTLQNDYVGGTLANLDNAGAISGVSTAIVVATSGNIGTLSNSGVLAGTSFGVNNSGAIGLIANSGTMSGTVGVFNGGTIGTILNTGSMIDTPAILAAGLNNAGVIGAVINQGTISGEARGLYNDGWIDSVTNSGTIAGQLALYNGGSIGTLNNSGILLDSAAPDSAALNNAGTLTVAINSGTIMGATYGILNSGTLGQLDNSGTIQAVTAIYNAGMLGPIANSGVIAGDIQNVSAQDLTFTGASGTSMGTLTGQNGGRGTITNLAGNVVFASGNLLLDDDVVATGHAVTNGGAVLTLQNSAAITGDFGQTAGSLVLATGQQLNVSGVASLTGGGVATTLPNAANYLAGTTAATLVTGGTGSTYTGVSVTTGPITGLALTAGGSGNDLVVTADNNYIGATLASLTNSGSLAADYPVYVAASGSLGSLANSGTLSGAVAAIYNAGMLGPIANSGVIAGNIQNVAAQALTISGGSGGSIGTLTGLNGGRGTITNSGGGVVFAGGNLLLGDDVVASAVANSGAVLSLATSSSITGAFSQTAGGLVLASGAQLNVSGAATLSGGTVSTTLLGAANYLAGTTAATLVTGGAGSAYTGVSVATGAIPGLALTSGTSGTNLVVTATNNYVGASLTSLTNSGSLTADHPVYVAASGSLGSLTNTGTLSGAVAAITNAGTLGPIANSGVIAGNIQNLASTDLRIAGGSGTSFGTLTGFAAGSQGTITNLASNLVLSGNLLLNDAINLGTRGLVSSAMLQLNNAVRVTGNYSQVGGALLIGVTSTSVYGQLQVSGSASLTNTNVRLVALGSTTLAAGTPYTVVKAGGALTYSGLTSSITGFDGSFSTASGGGTSDLVLTVKNNVPATQFAPIGVSAGGPGVGTGAALDAIVVAGNSADTGAALPVINDVLVPLAALPAAEQERAIVQLSPTQLTPQVVALAVSPAVNAIVQHQDVLAANASGRDERGMSAGSQGQRGNVWGQLLFNTAKRGVAAGSSPYAADSFGIIAGVDLIGSSTLLVGGAVSWVNSTANGRADLIGSRTRLDSYQATTYFTWQPGDLENGGFAVDGQLGFGYNAYRQQRRIDFLGRTARASYDGQQYLGSLRVSDTVPLGDSASLTPYAGLRAIHLRNDGYTERQAGTANMQVRRISVDSLNHEIGVQGGAIYDTGSGRFAPSVKLGWIHNYVNGPVPLTAILGGVTFTSTSTRGPRDGAVLGAGLTFSRNDRLRIGVQYDGEIRDAFQSHSGTVKLTVNF